VTQGRINLKVVDDLSQTIHACLGDLRRLPAGSFDEFTTDFQTPPAAESLLRRAIQALFDILRHLLAKGFGQGALEYRELARLAVEKGLVRDPRLGAILKELGGFRNRLTHFYQEVTSEELYGIVKDELGDVEQIAEELRQAAARMSNA
jgi:uncharacterized protein YutE (UPF0331/DUF86 family)